MYSFLVDEYYFKKQELLRLRACKLVSGHIKLAIAQTGDVAVPPLR